MADLNLTRDPWLAARITNHMGDNPELWSFDEHCVTLGKLRIWVANGRCYVRVYEPVRIEFRWYDRRIIWRAVKALRILNHEGQRRDAIVNDLLKQKTNMRRVA